MNTQLFIVTTNLRACDKLSPPSHYNPSLPYLHFENHNNFKR